MKNAKIASITADNVSFIWKLIMKIESWFWSFNEGFSGKTDAHIFVWIRPPYNVRVGYSIHTFIKRPKSTFSS